MFDIGLYKVLVERVFDFGFERRVNCFVDDVLDNMEEMWEF